MPVLALLLVVGVETLSKLLTYCVLRPTQPKNPQRDGECIVATATGWRPSVADWGDGVTASCTVGPIVH